MPVAVPVNGNVNDEADEVLLCVILFSSPNSGRLLLAPLVLVAPPPALTVTLGKLKAGAAVLVAFPAEDAGAA